MSTERRDDSGHGKQAMDLAEARVDIIRDPELVESRREQLLDAALDLFLEKGFASTTIRDICGRSGINPASIYDYVANKQDILRRLLNRLWFREGPASLPERLAAAGADGFEAVLDEYFREGWSAKRAGTLLAYRTVPHLEEADRRTLRRREEALLTGLAERIRDYTGAPADDQRVEIIANFIVFANAFGPLRDWLMRDVGDETARRVVVDGIMSMIRDLRSEFERPGG